MKTIIQPEILLDEDGNIQENCLVRLKMVHYMKGDELINCLRNGIGEIVNSLKSLLSSYDKERIFKTWFYYVRLVEEFINVRYELGYMYELISKRIRIDNECEMNFICSVVEDIFGQEIMKHFQELVSLFTGQFTTIYDLLEYLEKRRLHIMTILNIIPVYANGDKTIPLTEIRGKMEEWIDRLLMTITTGCQAIIEAKCLPDFYGEVTPLRIKFSHHYSHLEDMFLEPQRLTILDLEKYRPMRFANLRTKQTWSICSLEELDITLHNDAIYYDKYGLPDNKKYQSLVAFMKEMKAFFKDSYLIEITQEEFDSICRRYGELELYGETDDFYELQNSRYGFVKINDIFYSTYFMLIRFYVNSITKILRRNKTFQIDSGYIFEEKVKEMVAKYGYEYHPECRRIKHKEFDVVCVKDDVIYNFQCKNNYMSVASIGVKESDVASRYNRRLMKYYDAALRKEVNREQLLTEKLGLEEIKNLVVSRFPVVTDNKFIIPFNRLEEWLATN